MSTVNSTPLEIIQAVSRAVNSSLILEDIFDALGEVLFAYFPCPAASLVILDDTQNGIRSLVNLFADGGLDIITDVAQFVGYDAITNFVLHNQVIQTISLKASPQLKQSVLVVSDLPQVNDVLLIPLINKGILIGILSLQFDSSPEMELVQAEWLPHLAEQLAIGVENAKLYWQTQAQASREFLINRLTAAIRQTIDINSILETAAKELRRATHASRCVIQYFSYPIPFDALQRSMTTFKAKTFIDLAAACPPMGETFIFWESQQTSLEWKVFQLRQASNIQQRLNPFIFNDVRDCPEAFAERTYFEANQLKSMAIFPILIREDLVGTITLHQCDAYRPWLERDIDLVQTISEHLGVALHQASLFAEVDTQKRTLENTLLELQHAQMQLIQSEKMAMLGQFVAGIAHEINTPLGAITSNNQTFHAGLRKLPLDLVSEEVQKIIGTLMDLLETNKLALERIHETVRNLRNFARLDESDQKVVSVHEGIEATLKIMQGSIPHNIQVVKAFDQNLPDVKCFPGLLNQVFMNLMVNAIHAMEGFEMATLTIKTRQLVAEQKIEVQVEDTGKGIPKEHLQRIFDPGFTTKGVGVGTGLGLALCYRIIEKHQGEILVESPLCPENIIQPGTRFTVSIPLA